MGTGYVSFCDCFISLKTKQRPLTYYKQTKPYIKTKVSRMTLLILQSGRNHKHTTPYKHKWLGTSPLHKSPNYTTHDSSREQKSRGHTNQKTREVKNIGSQSQTKLNSTQVASPQTRPHSLGVLHHHGQGCTTILDASHHHK